MYGLSLIAVFDFIVTILCHENIAYGQNSREHENEYLKKEHSLVKPYSLDRWDFGGSTVITGNYIRLTSESQSKRGQLFSQLRNHMLGWESVIQFRVSGTSKDLYGDGMAFWYTRERMEPGDVFGSRDYFTGLGVFLDTYSNTAKPHNHAHPYISVMINNGTSHYDHEMDGGDNVLGGCEASFRHYGTLDTVKHDSYLSIRYERRTLTVSVDVEGKQEWRRCVVADGVILPLGYYFGVSAATGELVDNHDVISLKTFEIVTPAGSAPDRTDHYALLPAATLPAESHGGDASKSHPTKDSSEQSSFMFALTVFGYTVLIVAILGLAAYVIYYNYFSRDRKRFY